MRIVPSYIVSSNIDAVGWHIGQLYIRFKSGVTYAYKAPWSMFDALTKQESAGKFFHANIRNKLEFKKLDSDPFVSGV